jgi:hypothetical protein
LDNLIPFPPSTELKHLLTITSIIIIIIFIQSIVQINMQRFHHFLQTIGITKVNSIPWLFFQIFVLPFQPLNWELLACVIIISKSWFWMVRNKVWFLDFPFSWIKSKTQFLILVVLLLHACALSSWVTGITSKNQRRKVGVEAASNRVISV